MFREPRKPRLSPILLQRRSVPSILILLITVSLYFSSPPLSYVLVCTVFFLQLWLCLSVSVAVSISWISIRFLRPLPCSFAYIVWTYTPSVCFSAISFFLSVSISSVGTEPEQKSPVQKSLQRYITYIDLTDQLGGSRVLVLLIISLLSLVLLPMVPPQSLLYIVGGSLMAKDVSSTCIYR